MMETSVITAPLASKDTFSGAINLTSTCVLGNENARSPRVLDRLPVYDLGAYLRVSKFQLPARSYQSALHLGFLTQYLFPATLPGLQILQLS
jgi:hypothetical protein